MVEILINVLTTHSNIKPSIIVEIANIQLARRRDFWVVMGNLSARKLCNDPRVNKKVSESKRLLPIVFDRTELLF